MKCKGTLWVSLFIDRNTALYFHSFGIKCIPQEVLNKNKDKSVRHNELRIQDKDCIMCGFYCIAFIEYMIAERTLFDCTNLFSPNGYKKKNKVIYISTLKKIWQRNKT